VQRALEKDQGNRAELSQRARIAERMASLTPREREILDLVTSGKANKVMAADLGLSQRTVEIHRAHVMEKMGASSLAQLVRMALDMQEASDSAAR
jgi:FixJ family two-component response regulator